MIAAREESTGHAKRGFIDWLSHKVEKAKNAVDKLFSPIRNDPKTNGLVEKLLEPIKITNGHNETPKEESKPDHEPERPQEGTKAEHEPEKPKEEPKPNHEPGKPKEEPKPEPESEKPKEEALKKLKPEVPEEKVEVYTDADGS